MRRGIGDFSVAAAVVLLIGIGVVIEVFSPRIEFPPEARAAGQRFVERAVYCPPSVRDTNTVVVASDQGPDGVTVGIEPTRPEEVSLPAGRVIVQPLEDAAADVVGFGQKIAAAAIVRARRPVEGEAVALCSPVTSARWVFGAGASTLGSDQRMLIYNPVPHEAVVRITFLGRNGPIERGGLSDVAVPANGSTAVKINNFVRLERALGAVVEAKRGRVVAWRLMFDSAAGGPGGVTMSLGAVTGSRTWYFPEGSVAGNAQMRLGIANPTDEEASVTVSLLTGDEVLQPPSLVELAIPAMSVRYFPVGSEVERNQRTATGVSAVVQSTNDVAVVSELVMRYSSEDVVGTESDIGAPEQARRWYLPPATLAPTTDTVVVMNPGSRPATIAMTVLDETGGPQSPADLADLRIEPGGRVKLGLAEWTDGPAVVILRATQPVVAQRFSFSSAFDDVGAVIGLPVGD